MSNVSSQRQICFPSDDFHRWAKRFCSLWFSVEIMVGSQGENSEVEKTEFDRDLSNYLYSQTVNFFISIHDILSSFEC